MLECAQLCDQACAAARPGCVPVCLQDIAAIRASRAKVFSLHAEGKLQAWVDTSHGFKGVEQIPDAINYMLQGGHTGKVVIPL
jgi:NADPH-dependent curcumin reductase CurA